MTRVTGQPTSSGMRGHGSGVRHQVPCQGSQVTGLRPQGALCSLLSATCNQLWCFGGAGRGFCFTGLLNLLMILLVSVPVGAGGPADAATRTAAVERQAGMIPGPGCEDGLVLDDGTAETAYGWVPSAIWGEYVQTFPVGSLVSSHVDSVCVCWTRTRADDSLDFEIVVYSGSEYSPGRTELFSFPASVAAVPEWPDGAFVEVQAPPEAPPLNAGFHHIGVRWNPSADQFFFVCADQSPADTPAGGFFRDDRAQGEWGSVLETSDPIFADHRAMMVRVRAHQVPWIPTVGPAGLVVLVLLLAISGWVALRSR